MTERRRFIVTAGGVMAAAAAAAAKHKQDQAKIKNSLGNNRELELVETGEAQ